MICTNKICGNVIDTPRIWPLIRSPIFRALSRSSRQSSRHLLNTKGKIACFGNWPHIKNSV